jgi:hypothetical protein
MSVVGVQAGCTVPTNRLSRWLRYRTEFRMVDCIDLARSRGDAGRMNAGHFAAMASEASLNAGLSP